MTRRSQAAAPGVDDTASTELNRPPPHPAERAAQNVAWKRHPLLEEDAHDYVRQSEERRRRRLFARMRVALQCNGSRHRADARQQPQAHAQIIVRRPVLADTECSGLRKLRHEGGPRVFRPAFRSMLANLFD